MVLVQHFVSGYGVGMDELGLLGDCDAVSWNCGLEGGCLGSDGMIKMVSLFLCVYLCFG